MAFGTDTPPEVGAKTQFQPGVSGNPDGKPKGTKHLSTYIQEMMEDESFTAEYVEGYTLKKHKGAPAPALVRVAFMKSIAGDKGWADWLGKYGYGTKLELSNDPENPIGGVLDPTAAASYAAFLKQQKQLHYANAYANMLLVLTANSLTKHQIQTFVHGSHPEGVMIFTN